MLKGAFTFIYLEIFNSLFGSQNFAWFVRWEWNTSGSSYASQPLSAVPPALFPRAQPSSVALPLAGAPTGWFLVTASLLRAGSPGSDPRSLLGAQAPGPAQTTKLGHQLGVSRDPHVLMLKPQTASNPDPPFQGAGPHLELPRQLHPTAKPAAHPAAACPSSVTSWLTPAVAFSLWVKNGQHCPSLCSKRIVEMAWHAMLRGILRT